MRHWPLWAYILLFPPCLVAELLVIKWAWTAVLTLWKPAPQESRSEEGE